MPGQEHAGCFPCLLNSGFQVAQEDYFIHFFFIPLCSKVQISPISGIHSRTDSLMVHYISCQVLSQESCSWGTWGCRKLTSKLFLLLLVTQLTWCRKHAWGPWKWLHSRIQGGWIGYFIFWERLKFSMCMKTKCWAICLVSKITTGPVLQPLRAPIM